MARMVEKKAVDYTFSSGVSGVSNSGILFDGTSITQGVLRTNRVGGQISPHALYIKGFVNADSTDAQNTVRVLVFQWNDTTAPTTSDVFESGYQATIAPYRWSNSGTRLKILYDKSFISYHTGDTWRREVNFRLPFPKSLQTRYSGPGAGDGVAGRIYVMMISDSSLLPHPTCVLTSRLVFTDV